MTRIADIKERVTCFEVAEELGMEVDHAGKTWAFNRDETKPSVQLYDDHWFDFGTHKGGDVVDMVREWTGWSVGRVVQWFERGWGVEDIEPHVRKHVKPPATLFNREVEALPLMCELGLAGWPIPDDQVALWYDLRAKADSLVIPHWQSEECLAVKVRYLNGSKSSWTGSQFLNLYRRRRNQLYGQWLVLCEGESDTWAMDHYFNVMTPTRGPEVEVAGLPSGVNHWVPAWRAELNVRFGDQVYICVDNDDAGSGARGKIARDLGWMARQLYVPGNYKDAREALAAGWDPRKDMA